VIGSSERRLADATIDPSKSQRGIGATSIRSNQPCSMSRARFTPVAAPEKLAACISDTGRMNGRKSSVPNPRSSVRLPNTAVSPSMKIEGARIPGIAAPGTRSTS
jgi:hypothetical protein